MEARYVRLTALVSAIVFVDMLVWFAIAPLTPTWEDELGLTQGQVGVVLGAYSGAILLFSLHVGRIADRVGPRLPTLGATAVFALSLPLLAYADTFGELVAVRFAQGAFSAVGWTAGIAWLVSTVPVADRGRALSVMNASAIIAGLLGPAVGGALVSAIGLETVMWTLGAIVALLAVWGLFEGTAVRAQPQAEGGMWAAFKLGWREPRVRAALISLALIAAVQTTIQTLAPLHLSDEGLSESTIGWIFTAGAIGGAASVLAVGRLGGRVDRLRFVAGALGAAGVAMIAFVFALPTGAYAAAMIVQQAITSGTFTATYPLCADGADRAGLGQGLAMAMLSVAWAASALLAPIVAGNGAEVTSDQAVYAVLTVIVLGSAGALTAVARREAAVVT